MAQLRAIAPRVYIDTNPYVNRYPVWSNQVFYQAGAIVSKSFKDVTADSDSEAVYYNLYVCQNDTLPGSPQPDSDQNNWVLFASGDPNLPNFFNDSDVYAHTAQQKADYLENFSKIDSDIKDLATDVNVVLAFDSEIQELKKIISEVEEKNIIDSLFDSDARHGYALTWDSDLQKFKFVLPALSVNNVLPDANGNVSYAFTTTKTGTRDDRADSDEKGVIFVVTNDSDSDFNGATYSFTDVGWTRLIGYTDVENQIRYVNVTGDTMTGPLLLSGNPTKDSEAVTKSYVDGFNDSDKQDKIIILGTQSALTAYPKENNRFYYVTADNTMWIYTGGVLNKFTLPADRIFEPVILEAKVTNKLLSSFDVIVETYRFSDQIGGNLKLFVNNSSTPTNIGPVSNLIGSLNINGVYEDAKLQNATQQTFTVRVPQVFQNSNQYSIEFTSHDGSVTRVDIDGSQNKVAFSDSNRIFNFGEY